MGSWSGSGTGTAWLGLGRERPLDAIVFDDRPEAGGRSRNGSPAELGQENSRLRADPDHENARQDLPESPWEMRRLSPHRSACITLTNTGNFLIDFGLRNYFNSFSTSGEAARAAIGASRLPRACAAPERGQKRRRLTRQIRRADRR